MTFGSLFSGIGGLDLGLERAGMTCKWQVEIDDYATRILERHWPAVPRWRDIHDFIADADEECKSRLPIRAKTEYARIGKSSLSVDLICGGFPCQPLSVAGRRKGLADERWLWSSFREVIGIFKPKYVLIENVRGLLSGKDIIEDGRCLCGWPVGWGGLPNYTEEQQARHLFSISSDRDVRQIARRSSVDEEMFRWQCVLPPSGRQANPEDMLPMGDNGTCFDGVPSDSAALSEDEAGASVDLFESSNNSFRITETEEWHNAMDGRATISGLQHDDEDSGAKSRRSRRRGSRWVVCEGCGRSVDYPATRLVQRSWLGIIFSDLAKFGYSCKWQVLPAAAFGAPHLRERVFIVAHARREHGYGRAGDESESRNGYGQGLEDGEKANDNAGGWNQKTTANADQPGPQERPSERSDPCPQQPPLVGEHWRTVEPTIRRGDARLPHRVDRLRCLGNAVVPQIAEWIGERIVGAD